MRRLAAIAAIVATGCHAALAQPVPLSAGLEFQSEASGEDCVNAAASTLEPTQDSMFDLANLIVHSLCLGAKGGDLGTTADGDPQEAAWESRMLFVAGTAIAKARLDRLNAPDTQSE